MVMEIWVNSGLGNGLLPDGTKPLPEPMLTYHQQGPVTFIRGWFHNTYFSDESVKLAWKLLIKDFIKISQGTMSFKLTNHMSCTGDKTMFMMPQSD